ncbi:MAG: IS630 family transposase, partial [Candidatus Cloacimonetes bacterium]|nr:IS630 family transposase [Candidatus Cloacimonadota bacterium]MCF7814688.1 IS630 family transposase [Candidatus Cloacimonadota bacterium]MCF7868250.1 IS630 family transposase [Candidatus Cloacimonadota bacterium]MCF7883683.1 IS630 family transposase [Candidatus Cloacimonadota bacterium]
GSWLNMAEIELNVMQKQCLNRRIPDIGMLSSQVAAWTKARNKKECSINWQFTTQDSRVKLKRLYPTIDD